MVLIPIIVNQGSGGYRVTLNDVIPSIVNQGSGGYRVTLNDVDT